MPVLVTGATGMVGRAVVPRLVELGGQVRAFVRRDDPGLRELGVHVALGEADDEGKLESALEQVHTIVHLIGGALPARGVSYDWLNRETTEIALRAAQNAGVRRFVYLSFPTADPASPNAYLCSKGRAEEAIRAADIEYVIFRVTQILGAGGRLAAYLKRARSLPIVPVPGSGRQRLNPIALGDVSRAIVASDARGAQVQGTWDLGGPDVVTFDGLVALAAGGRRLVHVKRVPGLPRELIDLYASDAVAAGEKTARHFDLALTPLRDALTAAGL